MTYKIPTNGRLRDRAATALDLTHDKLMVGQHTEQARHFLAWWLDGANKKPVTGLARRWTEYLEMIARS